MKYSWVGWNVFAIRRKHYESFSFVAVTVVCCPSTSIDAFKMGDTGRYGWYKKMSDDDPLFTACWHLVWPTYVLCQILRPFSNFITIAFYSLI